MASGPVLGTQTPSTQLSPGSAYYDSTGLLQGHVFAVGLEKPMVLETLMIKYPLVENFGA